MRGPATFLTMIAAAATLAGCGGVKTSSTSDPAAQNVAEAAAGGTPASQTAAAECASRPDFVPIYADARISLCTTGTQPGRKSGKIVYTSAAEPKDVLGWSREQANASGLGQRMLTDTMYSAGEDSERSLMVTVEPDGSGSKVTVDWGAP